MEPIDRAALRAFAEKHRSAPGETRLAITAAVVLALLDALDAAERKRDEFRRLAEASLVQPCACGRPMPSVQSRLRCDACRAEGERDEARAACAAMRAVLADIAEDYGIPYDDQQCDAPRRATEALEASDAGAPLLAELRALRALRDRVGAVLVEAGCSCDCGHDSEGHDDDCDRCLACLVQGAINGAVLDAKDGG